MHFRVVKGDRPYAVPLTPAAREAVDELLAMYDVERGPALVGVGHKVTLWRWFHEATFDAGLPAGRRHPHLARHTAATRLYARTKDPIMVRDFLNHTDLSTIHRYSRVTQDQLREAMKTSLG